MYDSNYDNQYPEYFDETFDITTTPAPKTTTETNYEYIEREISIDENSTAVLKCAPSEENFLNVSQ